MPPAALELEFDAPMGPALKKLRNRMGWTQSQAAAQIGTSRSYLHRVESGHQRAGNAMLQTMAMAYKTRITLVFPGVQS